MKRIKQLEERIQELKDSKTLLKDALQKVNSGEKAYYKTLSSQLRSLLCSGNQTPLLFDVSNILDVELYCYGQSSHEAEMLNELPDIKLYKRLPIIIIDIVPFVPAGKIKYKFVDWLELSFTVLNYTPIVVSSIIKVHANKKGGSHYDTEIPSSKTELELTKYFNENGDELDEIELYLSQISNVTIHFIELVIEKFLENNDQ
jgi:hypothetical protein